MIYEDERTVDELVDDILSPDETIRSVARAGGMEPGRIVQALYEMDCVLERVAKA